MRKKNFKRRCEKRMIGKCQEVCRTYDAIQYVYADLLQASEEVKEIKCNVLLDGLDVGEYTSDFVCTKTDGDLMAAKQKSIFIRFNMDDKTDKKLYLKLLEEAGGSVSLTAYVKRILEEYLNIKTEMTERQQFHDQMLLMVREEIQSQGMKLAGALLAGIGTVNVPKLQDETVSKETKLPGLCEELPEELRGVLDLIG